MRNRPLRVAVHPEFAKILKVQAAMSGKSMMKYTESLAAIDNQDMEKRKKREFEFKI